MVMNYKYIIYVSLFLLAGCNGVRYVSYENDTNYLTFNHPFTDQAVAEIQSGADKLCRQRKQVAIKTTERCSLTQCTTNYQCIDTADATKYGL